LHWTGFAPGTATGSRSPRTLKSSRTAPAILPRSTSQSSLTPGWSCGEAKKNDRLANQRREERRKLGRLYDAARDLTADDVCLATAAAAWDQGTTELVSQAFADLGAGIIYEEGLTAGPRQSHSLAIDWLFAAVGWAGGRCGAGQ
jgi:hypothetical protein